MRKEEVRTGKSTPRIDKVIRINTSNYREVTLAVIVDDDTIISIVFPKMYNNSSFVEEAIANADVVSSTPNTLGHEEMLIIADKAIHSLWE